MASPDSLVVSKDTADLVAHEFELEPKGRQLLKGIETPVEVFRVSARRDAPADVQGPALVGPRASSTP